MATSSPGHNGAQSELRSYVDRIVHLEEEKREIAAHIKDLKQEAKNSGFDKRVLTQMVREAMMTPVEREAQREFEEICEVYRANLGMLGGTPLGEAARKRAAARPRKPDGHEDPDPDHSGDDHDEAPATAEPDQDAEPRMPPEDLDAAREKGREAARTGVKIFANPYVHGDPRRAVWDEGYCEASGSDGMEIPDAWRRKPKKKPGKGDEGASP